MAGIARRLTTAGLFALALAGGGTESAGAQERWPRLPDTGFIGMGVSGIATGELDEHLSARGYPTFGRSAVAPSLGAYWSLPGGLMLGGEWHGLILGEEAHQGREVGLGGGYGTFGVGYAVDLSPRVRFYPRLGIGGGGMGLWIESEGEEVGFDEVLADPDRRVDPGRHSVLTRGGMVVDLGAGVELRPRSRSRGPVIGLRLGYLATPFNTDWQLDGELVSGSPVSGGPAATLAGPYLRAVVGWGRGR